MMHTSLRERIVKPVDKNLRLQTFLDPNLNVVADRLAAYDARDGRMTLAELGLTGKKMVETS